MVEAFLLVSLRGQFEGLEIEVQRSHCKVMIG